MFFVSWLCYCVLCAIFLLCFTSAKLRQIASSFEMDCNQNLRSRNSTQEAPVKFVNKTQRDIDLYWVDYEGRFKRYKRLRPNYRWNINTFFTHPWIFMDIRTRERMHVENNDVFWPKSVFANEFCERKLVEIHYPMRSLRQSAAIWIVRHLKNIEQVESLEIPEILKVELKLVFQNYENDRKLIVQ